MKTDMDRMIKAILSLEREINACAAECEAAGVYMPAFATRLRIYADEWADRYPDETNGGGTT